MLFGILKKLLFGFLFAFQKLLVALHMGILMMTFHKLKDRMKGYRVREKFVFHTNSVVKKRKKPKGRKGVSVGYQQNDVKIPLCDVIAPELFTSFQPSLST